MKEPREFESTGVYEYSKYITAFDNMFQARNTDRPGEEMRINDDDVGQEVAECRMRVVCKYSETIETDRKATSYMLKLAISGWTVRIRRSDIAEPLDRLQLSLDVSEYGSLWMPMRERSLQVRKRLAEKIGHTLVCDQIAQGPRNLSCVDGEGSLWSKLKMAP